MHRRILGWPGGCDDSLARMMACCVATVHKGDVPSLPRELGSDVETADDTEGTGRAYYSCSEAWEGREGPVSCNEATWLGAFCCSGLGLT